VMVLQPGGVGGVRTTPRPKTGLIMKLIHVPRAWTDPLVRPKQCRRDTRFGTWNVRSGSLAAIARELARYKLYLLNVQDVRWAKDGYMEYAT
jgi:hypothetical protein